MKIQAAKWYGKSYFSKLATTVFSIPHALLESCHCHQKVEFMSFPLGPGTCWQLPWPIGYSESDATWLPRLGHKKARQINLPSLLLPFPSHFPPAPCRWHRAAFWLRLCLHPKCYASVCLGLASPAVSAKPSRGTTWPRDLPWLYLGTDTFTISNLRGGEGHRK